MIFSWTNEFLKLRSGRSNHFWSFMIFFCKIIVLIRRIPKMTKNIWVLCLIIEKRVSGSKLDLFSLQLGWKNYLTSSKPNKLTAEGTSRSARSRKNRFRHFKTFLRQNLLDVFFQQKLETKIDLSFHKFGVKSVLLGYKMTIIKQRTWFNLAFGNFFLTSLQSFIFNLPILATVSGRKRDILCQLLCLAFMSTLNNDFPSCAKTSLEKKTINWHLKIFIKELHILIQNQRF